MAPQWQVFVTIPVDGKLHGETVVKQIYAASIQGSYLESRATLVGSS